MNLGLKKVVKLDSGSHRNSLDQQSGPFRINENGNNDFGWVAHDGDCITDLKFSRNGSYLVSAGEDGFIRL